MDASEQTIPIQLRGTQELILFALAALVSAGIVYFLFLVVYRLYFHPLAKFPGPKLNAISDLPGVIWTLQGRMPMHTRRIHDKYGPVIRLSPNELSFNTVQGWVDIYGHRNGRQDLGKHPIHVGAVDPVPGVTTISMADPATHARQRKALSHGFSKKALWDQEHLVNGFVTKLMSIFHKYADSGEVFDIVKYFNFITFDVIGDLSFGESFGCLDKDDYHFWPALIFQAVKAGAIEQASRRFAKPGSPTQRWLQKTAQGPLRKQRADHLAYSREKVGKRLQDTKSERKDFIYYILKQSEHYDLSLDEVIVNAALFIVAGSETTASSLSALTNNLLRHPEVYAKLKQEVRIAFQSEDQIKLEAVVNLPYLTACIEEGLRVFPPAPIGFLREIQAQGDLIDGHQLPGGTAVSVSSWCAHHSSANFKDPDSFIPERWIEGNKEYVGDQFLAFRPFSLGPRGCIGKDISYLEMRLVLARMIWNFDLFNADDAHEWDPEDDMKNMMAYSTWQKPGLNVRAAKVTR